MPETTIELSIIDDFSGKSKTIQNSARALCKSFDELLERQKKLSERKLTLNADMTQARKELEKAERAYENLGDAISSSEKKAKKANYDRLTKELKEVRREAEKTKKELKGLSSGKGTSPQGIMAKGEGTIGNSPGSSALGTKINEIAGDEATQILLQGIGDYVGAMADSSMTADNARMVKGVAGGALSGAMAGSIVPGVGTLVGAIVGGIGGALTAAAQNFAEEDEFFKTIVEGEVQNALKSVQETVSSGSLTAKAREQSAFVFGNILGDGEEGEQFTNKLTQFSVRTPFSFNSMAETAKRLLNGGMNQEEIFAMMDRLGNAAAATGMDEGTAAAAAGNLLEMRQSGANAALLNPLTSNGIDAYGYIARAKGISTQEAQSNLSEFSGAEIADIILEGMGKEYNGKMAEWGVTYEGLESRVSKLQENLNARAGEGFNEARKSGLISQSLFYDGKRAEQIGEANHMMGVYQGVLKNEQERYQTQAMIDLLESKEYKTAEEAGDNGEMMRLLAEAKVKGDTAWMSSELYKSNMEIEERLLTDTRDHVYNINSVVTDMRRLQKAYNIGQNGTTQVQDKIEQAGIEVDTHGQMLSDEETYTNRIDKEVNDAKAADSIPEKAVGMSRVPYDGYRAILHQGEKIIPASKALETERSGGARFGDIHISVGKVDGDNVTEIVREMAAQLQKAIAQYAG